MEIEQKLFLNVRTGLICGVMLNEHYADHEFVRQKVLCPKNDTADRIGYNSVEPRFCWKCCFRQFPG